MRVFNYLGGWGVSAFFYKFQIKRIRESTTGQNEIKYNAARLERLDNHQKQTLTVSKKNHSQKAIQLFFFLRIGL